MISVEHLNFLYKMKHNEMKRYHELRQIRDFPEDGYSDKVHNKNIELANDKVYLITQIIENYVQCN